MKKKLKIAVFMGGRTPERDVSLVTGKQVVTHLDKSKYKVIPVVISSDGTSWEIKSLSWVERFFPQIKSQSPKLDFSPPKKVSLGAFFNLKPLPDVIFIAIHGPFGEDGTIQGMFEFLGISYTGSGVLASALGMNKIAFHRIMENVGIQTPQWLVADREFFLGNQQLSIPGPPWVVKPANQGSSVGVSLVKNKKNLCLATERALVYSPEIIVEEYLTGTEIACGVLGNREPKALPVIEICPKNEFFDYEAKYTAEKCEEIVPARISKKLTKEIQEIAIAVYQTIGCRGFARVDMIIKRNTPFVLEINTIPGLTPASLFPKEAAAAGISYPQLLDLIIDFALENR